MVRIAHKANKSSPGGDSDKPRSFPDGNKPRMFSDSTKRVVPTVRDQEQTTQEQTNIEEQQDTTKET